MWMFVWSLWWYYIIIACSQPWAKLSTSLFLYKQNVYYLKIMDEAGVYNSSGTLCYGFVPRGQCVLSINKQLTGQNYMPTLFIELDGTHLQL